MHDDDADQRSLKVSKRRVLLSLAVTVGIALFVIGFVMTLMSLSDDSSASAESVDRLGLSAADSGSGNTATLVIGLVLSMTGVVVATALPAAFFIQSSKHRN